MTQRRFGRGPTRPSQNERTVRLKRGQGVGCTFFIIYNLLACIPFLLFNGFVLQKLWGWFVTETFTTIPPVSLLHAIGIMLVLHFLFGIPSMHQSPERPYVKQTEQPPTEPTEIEIEWWPMIKDFMTKQISHPTAALAMGWVVHSII